MSGERAYGFTLFCDDIRQEIGEKTTFVGTYLAKLIVHQPFPLTLPKFGIALTYFEKVGTCSEKVRFRIFFPGDPPEKPAIEGDIPMDDLRGTPWTGPNIDAKDYGPEGPNPLHRVDLRFLLAPVVLKQKGLIKVRIMLGDELIRLGALEIDQQLPQSPKSPKSS